jgi:hypothetical protein
MPATGFASFPLAVATGWRSMFRFVRPRKEPPRRPPAASRTEEAKLKKEKKKYETGRECPALAGYQIGCLAQQMSSGWFDPGIPMRCCCETNSRSHCIERMR